MQPLRPSGYTVCFSNPNALHSQPIFAVASRQRSAGMVVASVPFAGAFMAGSAFEVCMGSLAFPAMTGTTVLPLAKSRGVAHLCAADHCQEEPFMKGLEKKKEDKKKPQKTLKEKRAEKHAKKESRS